VAVAVVSLIVFIVGNPAGNVVHANPKYAGIVIDAKTGKTLYSSSADRLRYPASLTKMMTMYMMFDALERGKLKKSTRIRMSKFAASKPPSKLGIRAGGSIKAEHAILALATKSANDVAAAVAEHLGGSEVNFGRMMTRKARQLGMSKTTFRNASGLTAKGQLTTARDMAKLGVALREHFPQYYRYFSTTNFKYGKARYRNHNRLLGRVKGVDGIKTGYTRASGFNLVSSVQTGGRSIVAVVMGGKSGKSRNAQMQKLISRYLGKASRGNKRLLIAARSPSSNAAVFAALPKRGPVPDFRPVTVASSTETKRTLDVNKPITVAAANSGSKSFSLAKIEERLNQDEVKPAVDTITTASTAKPSGWVIQVGASGSKKEALALLEKVRSKVGVILRDKKTYTETVAKGNTTLHRARFVGFVSKKDARNTCKALKRKKLACLALNT